MCLTSRHNLQWIAVFRALSSSLSYCIEVTGLMQVSCLPCVFHSELQLELDLPTSILEKVNFPHTFPLPPNLDHDSPNGEGEERTRGWFYYLAEIAIRHLLNRVVRTHSWRSHIPTDWEIRRLLAQTDVLETQLHEWHSSLPATLKFEIPRGYSISPHTDDLIQILRHRYLSCRELISRPFVKLCVDTDLHIDPFSKQRVIALASLGLRVLSIRLSQVAPYRHQGNWFLLRTVATASLILGSAYLASKIASRQGAQLITMPVDWKETVHEALSLLRPYFEDGRADVLEMKRVIESVLDACQ